MSRKTGLRAFWKELRRRRVVRSGSYYIVAAFVTLQLGEIVLPAFNAPDWVLQSLVVVLLLGLPVVLAFAWVYDLTPEGLERTHERAAGRVTVVSRVALLVIAVVTAGLGCSGSSGTRGPGAMGRGPERRRRRWRRWPLRTWTRP